ncbi:hypothetical protein H0H87_012250 [Tephrocybe sp. NHM501043]|nr:hypothetical protein H0H87_012250 [Tephrocybe sp. NHM501043]
MNERAIQFFGVLSSILIAAGLIPQYHEIIKRKEVVGISIPFITIDWLGGIFSFTSLLFRPQFDAFAGVPYALVIVMDGFIILAALILNPLARKGNEAEERAQLHGCLESLPTTATLMTERSDSAITT